MKKAVAVLFVGLAVVLAACAPSTPMPPTPTPEPPAAEPIDIVDTAIAAGSFSTLVTAVQEAGLEEALRGEGPFTVFAPTDDAFNALPDGTLEALLQDPTGDLASILLYHVVSGKVMAADVTDGLEAETLLEGSSVAFAVADGAVTINGVNIVATDIEASNGVIHVIDAVLLPPEEVVAEEPMDIVDTAIAAGSFSTLVTAVQEAGLEEALRGEGPFTVFAPTDDAFNALPDGTLESLLQNPTGDLASILLYHVISGKVMAADVTDGLEAQTLLEGSSVSFAVADGAVTINGVNIVATDIETSNGVIHVIDAVLLPPVAEEPMDIVDTAIAAGSFSILVTAVQEAGLEEALRGEGPFTVFAPTDDAFNALPDGTLEALLQDPTGDLASILLYHVISGKVMAADVTDGLEVETLLQGATVVFTVHGETVMINGVNIVLTDIEASNGVIHVIDAVILPTGDLG